jgi:glycosyltransferase involved in cell wall biosynthesis
VIWVNNLKRFKRPQLFVRLAHRLPDYHFVMIGRPPEGRFAFSMERVLNNAPSNFRYVGPKPVDEANDLIQQSDLLLYTSLPVEGFGNSFLQAWFRGVPTVSLQFELDGIPTRNRIGVCSRSFDELCRDVCNLMDDEPRRREMGVRAREYAVRHHNIDRMLDDHEQLFLSLRRRDAA